MFSQVFKECIPDFKSTGLQAIQKLWKGYGTIYRYRTGGNAFVVKHYNWKSLAQAQSLEEEFALERKINSFKNELSWYTLSPLESLASHFPVYYNSWEGEKEIILILSDLQEKGFKCGGNLFVELGIKSTLSFLAKFHARSLNPSQSIIPGGYWHLSLRSYEHQQMILGQLKQAAGHIQETIDNAAYQCLIHGDAKPANYAYRKTDGEIMAYDFQYWGKGIGVQDLACYLFGVVSNEQEWELFSEYYFQALQNSLAGHENAGDIIRLWRDLYPLCRLDYYRFLLGWNPQHGKLANYNPIPDLALLSSQLRHS